MAPCLQKPDLPILIYASIMPRQNENTVLVGAQSVFRLIFIVFTSVVLMLIVFILSFPALGSEVPRKKVLV